MKDNQTENSVVTLYGMGWSIRRISRELCISRERVRRIVVSNSEKRATTQDSQIKQKTKRTSKLDPYKSYIGDLLERYPAITGQRVYEHLRDKGYDGGITIVRDYLQDIRVVVSKTPVIMVETLPGQRGAHDWSDYNIRFTSKDAGELTAAFIYMDGVPREIKSDNQKACVDRWEPGNPIYNRKYLEFATWYRFTPQTITPGNPTENLRIERPFYYLEQNFLNGREFKDEEDLKQQLRQWLREVNDVREHRTTRQRPIDMYAEEHPYLQPLPKNHYDTSRITHQVVNQESCIEWKGYQYVVPQKYMYEVCVVRITETELIVYSPDGEQIVTHPLAKAGQQGRYVGKRQKKKSKPDLNIADVEKRLEAISPVMSGYIAQIKQHKSKSWGHHLRNLLALKINYQVEDILVAVQRAQKHKVYDIGSIKRFLENNSEPRYSVRLSFKPRKGNE